MSAPVPSLVPGGYAVPDNDFQSFYLIHIIGITVLALSILGSTYVLVRAFVIDKRYKSIGDRFPIYISIFDIGYSGAHLIDHAILLGTREYPTEAFGEFLGFINLQFLYASTISVLLISGAIFASVVFKRNISFGKWDMGLIVPAVGIPFLFLCILLGLDALGLNGYFHWTTVVNKDDGQTNPLYQTLNIAFFTAPFFAIIVMVGIFCIATIVAILRYYRKAGRKNASRPVRRMMAYCISSFIVNSPIAIWSLSLNLGCESCGSIVFTLLVVTGTNMGGISNAIIYFLHYKNGDGETKTTQKASASKTTQKASASKSTTGISHKDRYAVKSPGASNLGDSEMQMSAIDEPEISFVKPIVNNAQDAAVDEENDE